MHKISLHKDVIILVYKYSVPKIVRMQDHNANYNSPKKNRISIFIHTKYNLFLFQGDIWPRLFFFTLFIRFTS